MIDLKSITRGPAVHAPRVLTYSFEGVGKAQPLDAAVLTPHGFVPMGTIEVGDEVIGADGKAKAVTGVFPQGLRTVFRVTMTDGAETECCNEHLWATRTVTETITGKSLGVRSLSEIRDTMIYRDGVEGTRSPYDYPNHRIPVVGCVQFASPKSLPMDPYLLGLLLGDGAMTSACVEFHKPETDLHDRIAELLPPEDDVTQMSDTRQSSSVTGVRIRRKAVVTPRIPSATWSALRQLGLIGLTSLDKFIPDEFLMSDVDSRTRLLRGLCDTDGHVIHTGRRVEISSSSPRLCDGIMFLVRSLGGTVTLREKVPTYTYKGEKHTGALSHRMVMYFSNGLRPVSSVKHLAKWREDSQTYYRSIAEIEEIGKKECQCISVDSPDGLYVTDDFIVTHNTRFAAGAPDPFFLDTDKGSHFYDVARKIPQSWSEELEWLDAIEQGKVKCGSVVLDSITSLEALSHAEFFPGSSVDLWAGGYGKGDTHVLQRWRELLGKLERIWLMGKPVILVAHATVRKFKDPQGPDYDRFEVGVRPGLAGLLRQWSDYVFFCREEVNLTVAPKNGGGQKAVTTGTRWAYTRRCPAYDAKSRGAIFFPERFLLSWDEFTAAVESEKQRSKEMGETILAMLDEIQDVDLTKKVTEWLRQHPDSMLDTHQRVSARLETYRASRQAVADGEARATTQAGV
jgi:hypothetical protein